MKLKDPFGLEPLTRFVTIFEILARMIILKENMGILTADEFLHNQRDPAE